MKNRKMKAYVRLTLTYTLVFAIIAFTVFAVVINMADGKFLGHDMGGGSKKSYVNVMLLGVDKGGARTDVMILAHLDMINNSINMLQIPRDTYVADNGRGDRKINSGWGYNKEKTVFSEVYKVTGVEVDKYVLVDTSQFRNIIDAIGGVEFDVPINMNYDDPVQDLHIHLEKGLQKLDGDKAEQFVRFRKNNNGTGYAMGDVERLGAQQGFIKAAIKQLFSVTNALKMPKIISMFSSMIETNMSNSEMISYAPYIFKVNHDSINIMTLEGVPEYRNKISYFIADKEKNKTLINTYFVPDNAEMNEDEMKLVQQVIGTDTEQVEIDETKEPKKNLLNKMIKVDIVDASGGKADAENVRETLEYYGYRVTGITDIASVVNDKTQIVVKKDNGTGDKIAQMFGMSEFILNTGKSNGTQVTVVLGKDMS